MLIKKKTLLETRALKGVMMQSPLSIKIRVSSFHTFFFFSSRILFTLSIGAMVVQYSSRKQTSKLQKASLPDLPSFCHSGVLDFVLVFPLFLLLVPVSFFLFLKSSLFSFHLIVNFSCH